MTRNDKPKKRCSGECGKLKDLETGFYQAKNKILYPDGKLSICKICLRKAIYDESGIIDVDKFKQILQQMDIPFLYDYYEKAINNPKDSIGIYFKNLNSLPQNSNLTWKDSVFEDSTKTIDNVNNDKEEQISEKDLNKLKEKFGEGYSNNEYMLFEKKYQQLRPSAKILTTFHDEFFKEYCVDKVKETLAKGKGDFKEAKEWASMAKDAATAGKLNPSQMSKSDLSGGMDTFGQMSRMVEEHPKGELQTILPRFTERPKDKVDVTLWCYINYVRDLKGLPECDYKEIYDFYERRKDSYEKQMLDNDLSSTEGDN